MYTTQIPEEYYDVLTKEDLEEFSAFLNRNTENRVVHTNIETLIMRLKNKILKGSYSSASHSHRMCSIVSFSFLSHI